MPKHDLDLDLEREIGAGGREAAALSDGRHCKQVNLLLPRTYATATAAQLRKLVVDGEPTGGHALLH